MDAHELMLRRSQYICVLALVNARFSILKKQKPPKRKTKRFWVREYLKKREKYGQFHTLFSELRLSDREYFFRYIRMSPERFEHLRTLVAPYIEKKACRSRDPGVDVPLGLWNPWPIPELASAGFCYPILE